jgi:hypothetical protein
VKEIVGPKILARKLVPNKEVNPKHRPNEPFNVDDMLNEVFMEVDPGKVVLLYMRR